VNSAGLFLLQIRNSGFVLRWLFSDRDIACFAIMALKTLYSIIPALNQKRYYGAGQTDRVMPG